MGREFENYKSTSEARVEFAKKLREETKLLKRCFDEDLFESSPDKKMGLEIEAWLIDKDHLPLPKNDQFLELANHDSLVHELSQFNFEINTKPYTIGKSCFKSIFDEINEIWRHCKKVSNEINGDALLIGILPMIREEMLQLDYMSKSNRYKALNEELFNLRDGKPTDIKISGKEEFELTQTHLMMEAASTSVQVHLEVNKEDQVRLYNASIISSAPLVAVSANSPYLYGVDLWDETRIAVFEKAVQVASFRDSNGNDVGRVTMGTGYARHSLLEIFIENLDCYPILIPILFDEPEDQLSHLKLQNGTVWRWNRPIVGHCDSGQPHLRIEQRVMSSGPSLVDIVTNMAFYIGLASFLATNDTPPEEKISFEVAKDNFYKAAQKGLGANIIWFGKEKNIQKLILVELIPAAKTGLVKMGVSKDEADYYMDEVLHHRILKGQNGANWQRYFVDCYGKDFQALSQQYLEQQNSEKPVHLWKI